MPAREKRSTRVEQMLRHARRGDARIVTEQHLAGLPAPVERYLRAVGVVGKQYIRVARLKQKGSFRRGDKWLAFTAEQYFTSDPPGFVWSAKMRMMPFLSIAVTDLFVDGHGELKATLLGLFKVAEAAGPETDQGELLRFLGEICWLPTAWLSSYITWQATDEHSATATLSLPDLTVSAVARFDEDSMLREIAARRYMAEDGSASLRDWIGRFSDYQPSSGVLVPAKANAAWRLESGEMEYFRGEITAIEYDP